jgi:hypothetical protein
MRSVRDAFLDFQLTTLFDKNISAPRRVNRYKRNETLDAHPAILSQSGLDMLFAQAETLY